MSIEVVSHKFDGSGRKRWPARILKREGSLLVLEAAFGEAVTHPHLGRIERGTASLEFYWFDRWHNVFCFLDNAGGVRNFYCNINLPPQLSDGRLTYVDLDLDVLASPDGSWQLLDEDEFEANARRFAYSSEVRRNAAQSLRELIANIEARTFPFNLTNAEEVSTTCDSGWLRG
jgi:hypothetical protein